MWSTIISFIVDVIWGAIKKPFTKTTTQVQNAQIETLANERDMHADDRLSRGEF